MKKYLFLFAIMAISLSFMACSDDNDVEPDEPVPPAIHELVGTWRFTHPTQGWWDQFTFEINLRGIYRDTSAGGVVESFPFAYSVSGQVLQIVFDTGETMTITYELMTPTELLLNFGGGVALIYNRQ